MKYTPEQYADYRAGGIASLPKPPAGYTITITPGTETMTGWDIVTIRHDATGHEVFDCWLNIVGNLPSACYSVRQAIDQIADRPIPDRPKKPGAVTRSDAERHSWYYLDGPGRDAAKASDCDHGYRITDSCPCCP